MKRLRDGTEVDHNLIKIYEDLASEDEIERLQAVLRLDEAYAGLIASKNEEQRKTILSRLFRGLSSGRKAARLGFAIALTRLLTRHFQDDTIASAELIVLLEKCTKPESNTSGQDERDHYFGRLFGCEAIIKSEILFTKNDLKEWDYLLDVLCKIALQKPWLRQACGWTLYTCVKTSLKNSEQQRFTVRILEKMTEHKLVRTPEGLAIWIEVKRLHNKAKLPQHIWKHDDPLSMNDLRTLANVLKDAKEAPKDGSEFEVQGSAMWAANLHFVWDVILRELLTGEKEHSEKYKEYAQQFWQTAVDESLFNTANSQERKHWGFLVMQKALELTASQDYVPIEVIFSKNAIDCLVQSLKSTEGYLQRSASNVLQKIQKCCAERPEYGDRYVMCLLRAVRMMDFDLTTRTKTVTNLMNACDHEALLKLASEFNSDLNHAATAESTSSTQFRRHVLHHVFKLLVQQVHKAMMKDDISQEQSVIERLLVNWAEQVSKRSNFVEADKQLVLEKLRLGLEQVLKLGRSGQLIVMKLCSKHTNSLHEEDVDAEIFSIVQSGENRFKELYKSIRKPSRKQDEETFKREVSAKSNNEVPARTEGLTLLYALLLLEIHTGDLETISILQELLDSERQTPKTNKKKSKSNLELENADALVEILLSFASKPSKFLRRITLIIFESITLEITRDGLRSLTDILETKESKIGQEQLFEANGDEEVLEDGSEEDEAEDSDVEMLDSDVEVVSASDPASSEGGDSDEEQDSDDNDSDSESQPDSNSEASEPDASLLALETSLASVLGTRKLTQSDLANPNSSSGSSSSNDSDSDSDMTDTEMLALDDKLTEFFRARTSATQTSAQRKKNNKSARDTIVNFKNRVLDMLDAYVKREYLNARVLEIILPLLNLARGQTKQLAERAVKVLVALCKKCHGLEKVPLLDTGTGMNGTQKKRTKHVNVNANDIPSPDSVLVYPVPEAMQLLHQIHAEAGLANTSNLHRSTCSKASILVAKTLLKAGVGVEMVQAVYDQTGKRKEEDPRGCHVQPAFLEEWKNWKSSVKGRIEE